MENGYHLYSFSGQLLREEPVEQFKQWAWRPRPERLLSKDEMKNVRKNLREYSRQFEEADLAKRSTADRAVIEGRRRQLDEWLAWREKTEDWRCRVRMRSTERSSTAGHRVWPRRSWTEYATQDPGRPTATPSASSGSRCSRTCRHWARRVAPRSICVHCTALLLAVTLIVSP